MEQHDITTYRKHIKEDRKDLDKAALEYVTWYVFKHTQTQKADMSRSFTDQCYVHKH
jgi:hypothetical protein